ncbi:MAG: DUF2339 domain-containing protein [Lachnospiraceae bacterium]
MENNNQEIWQRLDFLEQRSRQAAEEQRRVLEEMQELRELLMAPPSETVQEVKSLEPAREQSHAYPAGTVGNPIYRRIPVAEKESHESVVGKNVMGILAAVLVLLGLASLAVLMYNRIPEIFRLLFIYLLSFILLGWGLWLHGRRSSVPAYSLMGCGTAGVFLAILVSNLVFHIFGNWVMYIVLLVWSMGTAVLSRYLQSVVFRAICQLGILIAVFPGIAQLESLSEMVPVLLFCTLAFAACEVLQKREQWRHAGFMILMFTFWCVAWADTSTLTLRQPWAAYLLPVLGILPLLTFYFWNCYRIDQKAYQKGKSILTLLAATLLCFWSVGGFLSSIQEERLSMLVLVVLLVAVLLGVLLMKASAVVESSMLLPLFAVLAIVLPKLIEVLFAAPFSGLALLIGVLLLLYHVRKQSAYLAGALLLMAYHLVLIVCAGTIPIWLTWYSWTRHMDYRLDCLLLLLLLMAELAAGFYRGRTRQAAHNSIWQSALMWMLAVVLPLSVSRFGGTFAAGVTAIQIYVVVLLVMGISSQQGSQGLGLNPFRITAQDPVIRANLTILLNIGFLCTAGTLMYGRMGLGAHVLLSLFYLLALVWELPAILKYSQKEAPVGWYIGIKFSIAVLSLVASFGVATGYPYLYSLILMGTAVVCIAAGFWQLSTGLRIYGLAAAMLAVLKLVTFDIRNLNSLIRVLAFLLGGAACFAISLLYNRAARHMAKPNEAEESRTDRQTE